MSTRQLQKMIHIACRDLGLDADARHDIQIAACGKVSMRDMDAADLERVVAHLKERGWKPGFNGASKPRHKLAPRGDLRLIHVLWAKLGEAGLLDRPGRNGLNRFIRARFGDKWQSVPIDVDSLRDPDQIEAVIRALKSWAKRDGVDFDWGRRG